MHACAALALSLPVRGLRFAGVDEAIVQLSDPRLGVYQRGKQLVRVTRDAKEIDGIFRPAGSPTISLLPQPRLEEILVTRLGKAAAQQARFVQNRGEWDNIRPLDAIATYPIMRRDGSLLLTSGYDAATRTLAEIDLTVPIPEHPTQADAAAALGMLAEVVSDFPFVDAASRSAWLAMLLTVPARPAIDGPTPLGLLEASQRGSGKTLLADLISLITTGAPVPRRVAPKAKDEWDKTIFSTLLAGDPIVLFDNITTMLASDALDAVLTGTTYSQRILGGNANGTVAVRTVFLASLNNPMISTDLVRRSVSCRLEPEDERPEARTGFKHADLEAHVRAHRAELISAALTVLRAYAVAGRPTVDGRPMGNYSGWCRVVRNAIVWAGGADPVLTQDALRESADIEQHELRDLLRAWHSAFGEKAVTVAEVMKQAVFGTALLDALAAIMPNDKPPSKHAIGNRLRKHKGAIVDGLRLIQGEQDKLANAATWAVQRTHR